MLEFQDQAHITHAHIYFYNAYTSRWTRPGRPSRLWVNPPRNLLRRSALQAYVHTNKEHCWVRNRVCPCTYVFMHVYVYVCTHLDFSVYRHCFCECKYAHTCEHLCKCKYDAMNASVPLPHLTTLIKKNNVPKQSACVQARHNDSKICRCLPSPGLLATVALTLVCVHVCGNLVP